MRLLLQSLPCSSLLYGHTPNNCTLICEFCQRLGATTCKCDRCVWISQTRQPALIFSTSYVAQRHIFGGARPGAMTPKFELGRDFCTMHLPPKLHHSVFTRSEVIVLTNRQTKTNRRSWKHLTLFTTLRLWRQKATYLKWLKCRNSYSVFIVHFFCFYFMVTSLPKVNWEDSRVAALSHTYVPNSPPKVPIPVEGSPNPATCLMPGSVRPTMPNGIRIPSAVFPQCTGQTDRPTHVRTDRQIVHGKLWWL